MTRLSSLLLVQLIIVSGCSSVAPAKQLEPLQVPLGEISTYLSTDFNSDVTECDRLGAHPNDPDKIQPGFLQDAMDLPKVIEVCRAAVDKDPNNPRLNYQLARAYGYSGKHADGQVYRNRAVRAGYPQSLFVIGYIRISGWDDRPVDACYGGRLMRLSAMADHIAGLISFPHHVLNDTFKECPDLVKPETEGLAQFLETAKQLKLNYYQRLLIERLEKDLAIVSAE